MHKQAVILAGGKGTRLMPLTRDIPKPMVSVAGKPFLYWQLRYLQTQGVTDAVLLISHLGHVIEKHFKQNPVTGLKIRFSTEPEPMGTGGALALALPKLESHFWLINGDSFLPLDLRRMAKHVAVHELPATLAVLTELNLVPVPGNVRLDGDTVSAYKKSGGKEDGYPDVDAGVYLLTRRLIESGQKGRFDLEAYWPALIEKKQLGAFAIQERFFDIGTPDRLKIFEEHLHDYF